MFRPGTSAWILVVLGVLIMLAPATPLRELPLFAGLRGPFVWSSWVGAVMVLMGAIEVSRGSVDA